MPKKTISKSPKKSVNLPSGRNTQTNIETGWQRIWRPAAMGALLVTVPGFYIGKVLPWLHSMNSWFWWATAILGIGSFLILKKLHVGKVFAPPASVPWTIRSWCVSLFTFFFSITTGYILMGYFWWNLGKIPLADAKNDLSAAGLQMWVPENSPVLPDEGNAVYILNQAWNTPSMRKFGSVLPIYDNPPNGRFENNTRTFGPLGEKIDLSRQPFFGKKTELDFLSDFNGGPMGRSLTRKEKAYARKLLKEHEDALRLLEKAFEVGNVDWGIDWKTQPTYPRWANYLTLTRLLRCRAFMEALDGNAAGAVKSVQMGYFFGDAVAQQHTLIAMMIDAVFVKMMSETICSILPLLESRGDAGKGLLPFMRSEKLEEGYSNALQYELFGKYRNMQTVGWFNFRDYLPLNYYYGPGWNKVLYWLFGVVYRPFLLFDIASGYEFKIKMLKPPFPGYWAPESDYERLWLLSGTIPRFAAMSEKTRETVTECNLARIKIVTRMFHQKYKRWPRTVGELEKWGLENGASSSGYLASLPEVKVTGAFVGGSKSPLGNNVTIAQKGEVPTISGTGWLFNSHSGAVYVNSTIKDSKNIPYSFYGFE